MLTGNTPLPVEQFGGLRLDLDPSEAGWGNAIDLQNVDFDRHGRVRSRSGSELFAAPSAPATPFSLFSYKAASDRLLVSGAGYTHALSSAGAVIATTADGPFFGAATIGTTSATECYLAYGTGAAMRVYDGTSIATPTATVDGTPLQAMPIVAYLGVTPWDNRLVCGNGQSATGGPGGTPSTNQSLHFSEPGDPQTFSANNYVVLNPGDGEGISAIVQWRELLFVFKRTKFYVFYGTSTAATGDPVFNYRAVRAGVGVNAQYQVAVARDGVYFFDATGVYRTTGADPELVSQQITPVFDGTAAAPTTFFTGPTNVMSGSLAVSDRRVYANVGSNRLFVYDIDTRLWTYWLVANLGDFWMVQHSFGATRGQLYFGYGTGTSIGRFSTTATTDQGTALTSRYRSGFAMPGGAGREAAIREVLLEGSGTVGFDWSRDYGAVGTPANVVMATPPAQGRGRDRRAFRGANLSYRLTATSSTGWQVNRLTPLLREARGSGEKTA